MEKIQRKHPLTHDLFIDLAELFNIKLTEVNIYKLERGVFYAQITCVAENGTEKFLEARTSDAVALALQFGCPIYTTQRILDEAGIVIDQEESEGAYESFAGVLDLSKKDIEELRQMLEDAIVAEDYEYASKIRDEIKVRS
jgi:bifunctional DNase/RNase